MRKYIDASLLEKAIKPEEWNTPDEKWWPEREIGALIDALPAADVVEVVRCRECVMWDDSFVLNGKKQCLNIGVCTDGDFYCGWGSKE